MITIPLKTAISILKKSSCAYICDRYSAKPNLQNYREGEGYDDYFCYFDLNLYAVKNLILYPKDNSGVRIINNALIFIDANKKDAKVIPLFQNKFLEMEDYDSFIEKDDEVF